MGYPQPPDTPHLYPQSIQLKLYQAFIFSIPILFSIILIILFYLFYLKRRASTVASPQPTLPIRSLNQDQLDCCSSGTGLKGNIKDSLPIILFDEELTKKDSMCCVCLGEFMIKEELHQIRECKHIFHVDCIGYWLYSSLTCPLCRCSIATTDTTPGHSQPSVGEDNQDSLMVSPEQPVRVNTHMANNYWERN